jgi:hypothetical protein
VTVTADELLVDRILHLNHENDRLHLIKRLKQQNDLPISCEEVEKAILFLSEKLEAEWLTVYPLGEGEVVIRIGPKNSKGIDFFSEIVPLGLALFELGELKKFSRLIDKLNAKSNERISAILEALSAARYKKKGYEVELEPTVEKGRIADFRVRFGNEWIYFECKKEYPQESRYYKSLSNYVKVVTEKILARVESKLLPEYRIDVILSKRIQESTLTMVIDKICECLDTREYNQWQDLDGMKFAVNSKENRVALPSLHVRQGIIKVGTTPTKLGEENFHMQVIYNPFSNKELQKVRRIIKEANEQLPRTSRGIIILETLHAERMITIGEEKLKEPKYAQVIAILMMGNGAWSIPNVRHRDFPLDFLKISVIPR